MSTTSIQWPAVSYFMNADEIAQDASIKLSPVDAEFFASAHSKQNKSWDEAYSFSMLGQWIRNTYHLWHPDNPHTTLQHVPVLVNGVDHSPYHADNFSGVVIEKLMVLLKLKYPSETDKMIQQLKDLGLAKS